MQPAGELILVVALDQRAVLRDQPPQPDGRGHLAVCEMGDDLPRRPFARSGAGVQLPLRDALQGFGDRPVAICVSLDQCPPSLSVHSMSPVTCVPGNCGTVCTCEAPGLARPSFTRFRRPWFRSSLVSWSGRHWYSKRGKGTPSQLEMNMCLALQDPEWARRKKPPRI